MSKLRQLGKLSYWWKITMHAVLMAIDNRKMRNPETKKTLRLRKIMLPLTGIIDVEIEASQIKL